MTSTAPATPSVCPSLRHDASLMRDYPAADRLTWFANDTWISIPEREALLEHLQAALNAPRRNERHWTLRGLPGEGRTALLRRLTRALNRRTPGAALLTNLTGGTERALYTAIIRSAWWTTDTGQPVEEARAQAVWTLRAQNARILIIDDVRAVQTWPDVYRAADTLAAELNLTVLWSGQPEHLSHPPLTAAPSFTLGTVDPRTFADVLLAYEHLLPVRHGPALNAPPLRAHLRRLSGGRIGELHRLLSAALETALRRPDQTLRASDLTHPRGN